MPVNDELATEQWTRFRFCVENGHQAFIQKADKCDKFVAGDQWDAEDLAVLKAQGRPALTINKMQSTLETIEGDQIQNRNEVLFRPATGASAETAEALSKVWMQIAQNNQLPWVRSEVFSDGLIRSRGFYDVRLDFSDTMKGEVRIRQENSKNVVIDPDGDNYDPDTWMDVFVTKWLTYQDIAIVYDEADALLLKGRDTSGLPFGYDSISRVRDRFAGPAQQGYNNRTDPHGVGRNIRVIERQYRKLAKQKHFVDIVQGDTRPIPDGWDRNKIASVLEKAGGNLSVINKQVKRIRWTVTADNIVLHDEWSPYKHFTVVPYFPRFRYGTTTGVAEHILGPQELLNKTTSQELHVVNTTANSGWKVKSGALKNMSIEQLESNGAQTGLVLELDDISAAEKIQPNQTPTGLDRLSYKAEEAMKSISNVTDSMQGNDREDVAAKAIAYKQQRGSVNHTKAFDNLERSDWLLARNVLDIVQEFYTEERVLHITHDDVSRETEQVVINKPDPVTGEIINDMTLGEYNIIIVSTPYRASMEDSQFEQALSLRKEGIGIPDNILIENSRLMRRSEIVKQMSDAANSPEAQQKAQLEIRNLTAQVAKLEAEVGAVNADTQLKGARAEKEGASAQQLMQGDQGQADIEKARAEMEMERERLDMEMSYKREEMAMKQEDHRMKMEQQGQMHAQELAHKEQAAQQDRAVKITQAAAAPPAAP